jgi:hypothetical protein
VKQVADGGRGRTQEFGGEMNDREGGDRDQGHQHAPMFPFPKFNGESCLEGCE